VSGGGPFRGNCKRIADAQRNHNEDEQAKTRLHGGIPLELARRHFTQIYFAEGRGVFKCAKSNPDPGFMTRASLQISMSAKIPHLGRLSKLFLVFFLLTTNPCDQFELTGRHLCPRNTLKIQHYEWLEAYLNPISSCSVLDRLPSQVLKPMPAELAPVAYCAVKRALARSPSEQGAFER
jgi:hypothetical protein